MDESLKLKIFECTFDYHWGTLWWGEEKFIRERFENWCKNNRKGHPLLSLHKTQISALCDNIPMLVGTSIDGKNVKDIHLPIRVSSNKITDFGTQVESKLIFPDDFIFHENSPKVENDPLTPVWKRRKIWPNFEKRCISEEEDKMLQNFLSERKDVALEHGGYNHE